MNYIKRHVESTVIDLAKMFPAVLVTGARQVGKTTLLKNILPKEIKYVTFDNRLDLALAKEQQELFFKQWTPPVIVDEVQYAPNLFSEIKMIADNSQKKGSFYLTGSQTFQLMKDVSESMAGRVGIVNISGLSLREINGESFNLPFVPTKEYCAIRNPSAESDEYWRIWQLIHRGSMPSLVDPHITNEAFYSSYVSTYLERDIRDLTQIGDELTFLKFMTAAASMTGNLLNYDNMAQSVGVSANTIKRWVSVLAASGIIYILEPYFNNIVKRAVKTPKLYFMDTGLVCYLTKWKTAEQAATGAMNGALLETFVVSEIVKSYYNVGISRPPLFFYRDKEKNEIDLIIEDGGILYPVEIKKTGKPDKTDIKAFSKLDNIAGMKRGTGGIVSMADQFRYLDENNFIIPLRYL